MFPQLGGSMEEIWKDIPNYEGLYQASNLGRVRSLDRTYKKWREDFKRFCICKVKGRILKLCVAKNHCAHNYQKVSLVKNTISTVTLVHKIITETFLGKRPNNLEVRHLDGNGMNNIISNLEYSDHKTNMNDRRKHGTIYFGENHFRSIFKNKYIINIRRLYNEGKNMTEISKLYNCNKTTIRFIVRRFSWRNI